MSTVLEAEAREEIGKGASRRLRRLENKVPAIIYGGNKESQAIHFQHNKLIKALEDETIFSSVFNVKIGNKTEHVILKDLQRHPYKAIVLHMDLQRVSPKDVLVKEVPLHFINEEQAKGVKAGGIINHTITQIEIRCQAKDLPAFIEINMAEVELGDVIHAFDLKLPKDVQLTVDTSDESHNFPVASIHLPKVVAEPEEIAPTEEALEGEEGAAAEDAPKQEGAEGGKGENPEE